MNNTLNLSFTNININELERDIISIYESLSNKKLFDGDPIKIFLNTITHVIFQQQKLIDFTAKQNLLLYATEDYLDNIVALVGVSRLQASKALTTLKFTITSPQVDTSIVIPQSTRVKVNGLYFQTIAVAHIPPGELTVDVVAECTTDGAIGNNILPGQITEIVDVFPFFQSVTNITKSSGGADIETDDELRERAFNAPNAFSTAGSDAAYEFFAKSVSPVIMDVKAISENPGEVSIIAIGKGGEQLSEEILNKILEKCSDKKVKPLTDKVIVSNAIQSSYAIDFEYFIDDENKSEITQIQSAVSEAVTRYTLWQNSKLGRDINPNKLMFELMSAGVKRVEITSPIFTKVASTHIAKDSTTNIKYGGIDSD